ncbi:uncharacterized protein N7479_000180 [Penicillium vulpinum]|uniref:Uncharacterized protein n=1 Tax=Penicillium vulpinum TaxID=29845 RepID=A0A1V6RWK3_9EURO|nr:uncharacterized protein N7479_000180 [Penicillium vulpinum]KAJ5970262.1 hypothetical protein N7479_000180 [Penicillium vulpinum]OQE06145.1 hypothetical protein PENVUL_c019G07563 [Penicillium vulpinum]
MDIELRRLEKSMIAQSQQLSAPQEKTDHPAIKDDSLLSRNIQRGDKQQTYSRRVTRSSLKNESSNFISIDSLDQTDNIPDSDLPSDCVLFYIPSRSIQSDILDFPVLSGPNRYSFDLAANLLLVKMITIIHSDIGQFINLALTRVITQMGLAAYVRFYAGATIREEGCGKEGDQGWGPLPVPQGFPDKPTVTLELYPAKGNVNTTVTIKVDRKRPRLMVDRWERIDGVVQTTQQIEISKVNGQIELTNDSLTVPFESLFLRQPTGDENDITLDRQTLQELADRTWRLQGL